MKKTAIILIIVLSVLVVGFIAGFIAFRVAGNIVSNKISGNITGNMANQNQGTKVKMETSKGDIVLQLYDEQMPITTANFEKLVSQGFYNGVIFHRVISGFMIQGGDPQGTGMGGPGYTIKDEYTHTSLDENIRGTIAMAKSSAPNSAGSQFFINLVDNSFLNGGYSVFGKVIQGMDVVDAIGKVQTDANDKPLENVTIIRAEIV